MSNDWFRSWHGAPTDNKWLLIAKRAGVKPIHVSGTWWALLDHASQHSDRGRVDDFDVETFALFAGLEEDHVSRIVTTLTDKGLIVDGRIYQWGKRQPKREDETAGDRKRRQREKDQQNPPHGGGNGGAEKSRHAMSRNVTPDKDTDKIREEGSVTSVTGTVVPHPAAADFCKAVFDSGVALLVDDTRTDRQARSIMGRIRQAIGDPETLILVRDAENKSDPAAWLMAAVETRNGTRKSNPVAGLRGSRPDPAIDLLRASQAAAAEEAASGDHASDFGIGAALPSYLTG